MTTEFVATRARVQAMRVRMAAAAVGYHKAVELHRALERKGSKVGYESIRRIFADEWKEELPFTLIEEISEVTGFSTDWLVGKPDASLPDQVRFAKGVSRSSFGLVPAYAA